MIILALIPSQLNDDKLSLRPDYSISMVKSKKKYEFEIKSLKNVAASVDRFPVVIVTTRNV